MATPNTTLSSDSYVPILKCKKGELGALSMSGPLRPRLLPLIEVPSADRAASLAASWGDPSHAVLVQPLNLDEIDESTWPAEVSRLFDELRSLGAAAVPVVTMDDTAATIAAVAAVVAIDGRGAALRIEAEEIVLATPAALQSEVDQLLHVLNIAPDSCDLLIDAGLVRDTLALRVTTAEAGLRVLPHVNAWRNLVTTFSAFPDDLGSVAAKGVVTPIARDDAAAYATLVARGPERIPVFSDHGVGTPFYVDAPWAPIPSIRYAVPGNWMVHRGVSKANRSAQYLQLAGDVASSADFSGRHFSAGDEYIDDVATGVGGPGNPMTFVRAATSRHFACVLDLLARTGAP
jgi:hypothetical protein